MSATIDDEDNNTSMHVLLRGILIILLHSRPVFIIPSKNRKLGARFPRDRRKDRMGIAIKKNPSAVDEEEGGTGH